MKLPEIRQLFPAFVVTECCPIDEAAPELPREEAVFVEHAVEKRKREFTTGRHCARKSLQLLGIAHGPLLMNGDRDPVWPDNVVGSITHCDHICATAIARKTNATGIGVDIELTKRMKPEIARRVLTEQEAAWIAGRTDHSDAEWAALVFSAKESIYKCLYPLIRTFFGFETANLTIRPDEGIFIAELQSEVLNKAPAEAAQLEGRYLFTDDIVATGIILPCPADSSTPMK